MRRFTLNRKGFTVIELLVATAVFSVILLITATALLDIGNTYYKGYLATQTQQATRHAVNTLAQTIEFGGVVTTSPIGLTPGATVNNPSYLCVGSIRYTFTYDKQLVGGVPTADQANHVIYQDAPTSCAAPLSATGTELAGNGMRLAKLQVKQLGSQPVYSITLRLVYGEHDVLNETVGSPNYHQTCIGGAGQQYCSTSELSTTVQQRVQ